MLLHVEDATKQGYTKVSIRTVDTDVVVLAVAAAERLSIDELWVAFGTGKSFRFLAAHEMAQALGPDRGLSRITRISSFHWVWYRVKLWRQEQKDCMEDVEGIMYVMRSLRPSVP